MRTAEKRPVNPDVITDENGVEYILLAAALKLMPGVRAGKPVHVNTAHRMIQAGRLKAKYRQVGARRYWYVRKDQVERMSRLIDFEPDEAVAGDVGTARFTKETLERLHAGGRERPDRAGCGTARE